MILSKYNRLKIRWFYSTIPWEFLNRITSSPWPATNCLCKVRLVDQQWFYVKIPREFCHRIKTVRGDSISTFPGNVEIDSQKQVLTFFCIVYINNSILRSETYLKRFVDLVASFSQSMSPWRATATPKVPEPPNLTFCKLMRMHKIWFLGHCMYWK